MCFHTSWQVVVGGCYLLQMMTFKWRLFADKPVLIHANYCVHGNLLATKAIARKFFFFVCFLFCFFKINFRLATACNLQQPFSNRLQSTQCLAGRHPLVSKPAWLGLERPPPTFCNHSATCCGSLFFSNWWLLHYQSLGLREPEA